MVQGSIWGYCALFLVFFANAMQQAPVQSLPEIISLKRQQSRLTSKIPHLQVPERKIATEKRLFVITKLTDQQVEEIAEQARQKTPISPLSLIVKALPEKNIAPNNLVDLVKDPFKNTNAINDHLKARFATSWDGLASYINAPDQSGTIAGNTALLYAVTRKTSCRDQLAFVQALLYYNANRHVRNAKGDNALTLAVLANPLFTRDAFEQTASALLDPKRPEGIDGKDFLRALETDMLSCMNSALDLVSYLMDQSIEPFRETNTSKELLTGLLVKKRKSIHRDLYFPLWDMCKEYEEQWAKAIPIIQKQVWSGLGRHKDTPD